MYKTIFQCRDNIRGTYYIISANIKLNENI